MPTPGTPTRPRAAPPAPAEEAGKPRAADGAGLAVGALREADLPGAAALLEAEGWVFTTRELGRILATGPGLSVVARAAPDAPVQGVVMVARLDDLAWVGNVVVAPALRGRGAGEAMMRDALDRIRASGVATTKLYSVPLAVGLYQRVGFRAEGEVRTWQAYHDRPTHRPREVELLTADDLPEAAAMDRAAFGADRSALLGLLLRDHPDTGVLVRDAARKVAGYGFLKAGDLGTELGPVVVRPDLPGAEAEELAGWLLDGALGFRLRDRAADVECTAPEGHPWMARLLELRGFRAQDWVKTTMVHGPDRDQDLRACAAVAGLEKG